MSSPPNDAHAPPEGHASPSTTGKPATNKTSASYWSKSLQIVGVILVLWAFISLGCGVLFRDFLDAALPNIGGAPFGFWMAQQGSIIGFLLLLFLYMVLMNGLDRSHGFGEDK